MWQKLSLILVLMMLCQSSQAKTFTVDGEEVNLAQLIDKAEQQGTLSREQAIQIRTEENAICQKELRFKSNSKRAISSIEQAQINREVINLRLRIQKLSKLRADNTGKNVGDGRPESPTAQVQSSKPADLRIVTAIRRAVMKDQTLSNTAKNTKIIVINGKVVLRGPVKSSAESNTLFALAENCVGARNILNELQVLPR
ncbi:hypothetical protein BH11CYA1_BH11CYA1_49170 [soil metagenome]